MPETSTSASGALAAAGKGPMFDLSNIDLSGMAVPRAELEHWNPHRGEMALLDGVVWHAEDFSQAVGVKTVRDDEFWVAGHFPSRPLMPGVLQVECAAQLGSFMYNVRQPRPRLAAFTRIAGATFRGSVSPGDKLYVLAVQRTFSSRGFTIESQGLVNAERVAFEATISGVAID